MYRTQIQTSLLGVSLARLFSGRYRHHLHEFGQYLRKVGITSLGDLSPALLASFIVECAPGMAPCTRRDLCCHLKVLLRFCWIVPSAMEVLPAPHSATMRGFCVAQIFCSPGDGKCLSWKCLAQKSCEC
jgi:hypothetical protein